MESSYSDTPSNIRLRHFPPEEFSADRGLSRPSLTVVLIGPEMTGFGRDAAVLSAWNSALDTDTEDPAFCERHRKGLTGHERDGTTATIYEDDYTPAQLQPLVNHLASLLPYIPLRELNLRPLEWQKFGRPRGQCSYSGNAGSNCSLERRVRDCLLPLLSGSSRSSISRRSPVPAALARRGEVTLAFCWADVRRRFFELAAPGTSPVATDVLKRIAQLYKIEAGIRGQSSAARRLARQKQSRPIIEDLRRVLDARLSQLSRKSRLAEAIRYALTRWDGRTLFLDDGGEHWAVIASMIGTCKLNAIDLQAWLTDTLSKLAAGHRNGRIGQLMSWNYPTTAG